MLQLTLSKICFPYLGLFKLLPLFFHKEVGWIQIYIQYKELIEPGGRKTIDRKTTNKHRVGTERFYLFLELSHKPKVTEDMRGESWLNMCFSLSVKSSQVSCSGEA